MYVIAEGAIELDFGDDLIAKRLGPCEFFGELGLLIGDHARSADAIAPADGLLIELRHEEFQRLVEREPGLVSYFLRRAIMRVVLNEQGLIRRLRRRNQDLETALDSLRVDHAPAHPDRSADPHRRTHRPVQPPRPDPAPAGPPPQRRARRPRAGADRLRPLQGRQRRARPPGRRPRAAERGQHPAFGRRRRRRRLPPRRRRVLPAGQGRHRARTSCATPTSSSAPRTACCRCRRATPLICTLSLGACLISPSGDWNDWYAHADAALYRAKRLGGNRVEWQDDALDAGLGRPARTACMDTPEHAPRNASEAPQLRTLLLTDLCDSTGLVERLGDTPAAELFREHDRLVLQLAAAMARPPDRPFRRPAAAVRAPDRRPRLRARLRPGPARNRHGAQRQAAGARRPARRRSADLAQQRRSRARGRQAARSRRPGQADGRRA